MSKPDSDFNGSVVDEGNEKGLLFSEPSTSNKVDGDETPTQEVGAGAKEADVYDGNRDVIEPKMTGDVQGVLVDYQGEVGDDLKRQPSEQKNYSSFTTWEKRFIVFTATMGAFFSPFTAQIYFPALNSLAKDLNVSYTKINLTMTTYMVRLTLPSNCHCQL
jgi:hypothetical protein